MEEISTSSLADRAEPSSRRDWTLLALASLGKAALYILGSLALWAVAPLVFGMEVTTVASGSMEPQISTGDVVAALPVEEVDLRIDQVVLFEDPAVPDRLRLHRIIGQSEEGIQTQGDANPDPDSMLVAPEAVHGVGFVRVPAIGMPINWLHGGEWLKLGAFIGVLGSSALLAGLDGELRRRDREARGPRHLKHPVLERSQSRGLLLPVSVVLLTAVLSAYAMGSFAHAAFSSQTTARASFAAVASFAKPWDSATFHWGYGEQAPNLGAALDDVGTTFEHGVLTAGTGRATEAGNPFVTLDGVAGQIYGAQFPGAAPSNFTVETWFKTTTTRGGKLMGYGNSQSGASTVYDRHLYMTDAGKLTFGLNQPGLLGLGLLGGPITISSPQSYNDGQWHLATASVSSTGGTVLYVDGVAVASNSSMTTGQNVSNGYWRVGYDSIASNWPGAPTSKYFAGGLDNTSLYPTALSPAEAASHYSYGR